MTLYTRGFSRFVASTTAPVATGRSESCRAGFAPAERRRLFTAHDIVGPYWPPQRRHVEQGYRDLPFPFVETMAPPFEMARQWTADDLVAYVGTWSATQRCLTATGTDPLPDLRQALAAAWPDAAVRRVSWPLHLRVGTLG